MSGGSGRSWGSLRLWGLSPDCPSLVCQGTLSEFCLDSETNREKKRSILMCKGFVGQQGAAETGCKRSSYTAVYIGALGWVTVFFFFHKTKNSLYSIMISHSYRSYCYDFSGFLSSVFIIASMSKHID